MKTIEQLIRELRLFNHHEAASALEALAIRAGMLTVKSGYRAPK